MGKKDRMKNGLASLFDDNYAEEAAKEESKEQAAEGLQTVRLSLIEPDREQPRSDFDEEKLSELADNIAQMGILQPILVRPAGAGGRYTIVAGERRWRAARIAGLTEVPVIIREFSDAEASQVALIENLQREDLNPIEEAKAFSRLRTKFGMTQEQIANAVGKSRAAVANSMRLLDLPDEVSKSVEEGRISVGHAKVLLGVRDISEQKLLAERVAAEELSVRELEKLAAGAPVTAKRKPRAAFGADSKLREYSLSLKNAFGIDARFKKNAKGETSMKVVFGSDDELKEFLKRLTDK